MRQATRQHFVANSRRGFFHAASGRRRLHRRASCEPRRHCGSSCLRRAAGRCNDPTNETDPTGLATVSGGGDVYCHMGPVTFSGSVDANVGYWWIIPMDCSFSITVGGGPSMAIGPGGGGHATWTNACDTSELNGSGESSGVNSPIGGASYVCGKDENDNTTYRGVSIGGKTPFAAGAYCTHTQTCSFGGKFPWHPNAKWWFGWENPLHDPFGWLERHLPSGPNPTRFNAWGEAEGWPHCPGTPW
jgi:hypothetical protein